MRSLDHLGRSSELKNLINAEKVNKAGYTAIPVACGWAVAVIEVTRSLGQEK